MSTTNPTSEEPTLIQLQNRVDVAADQLTSARIERDEAATRSNRMEVQSRVEFLEGVLDAHQRRLQDARRAAAAK